MNSYVIYLVPALGILGLVVMAVKAAWVTKQDAGDENMQQLAGYIADGAIAFLKAEWRVLSIFVVITAILLAYSGTIHEVNGREIHSSWVICLAFIIGAVFSATAGFIGMKVATKANVRTTQAARTSLKKALQVSPGWLYWAWADCSSSSWHYSQGWAPIRSAPPSRSSPASPSAPSRSPCFPGSAAAFTQKPPTSEQT